MNANAPVRVFKLPVIDEHGGVEVFAMAAGVAAMARIFNEFAKHLIGWNLETDDGPVAATEEMLLTLDPAFGVHLVAAWMQSCADQLGQPADEPIDPADIPMEVADPEAVAIDNEDQALVNEPAATTVDVATARTEVTYSSSPVPQLQQELRRRELEVSGKKAELIARLEAHDQETGQAASITLVSDEE